MHSLEITVIRALDLGHACSVGQQRLSALESCVPLEKRVLIGVLDGKERIVMLVRNGLRRGEYGRWMARWMVILLGSIDNHDLFGSGAGVLDVAPGVLVNTCGGARDIISERQGAVAMPGVVLLGRCLLLRLLLAALLLR